MNTVTDSSKQLTERSWPRNKVSSIETRKRDVVVRIADWTRRTKDEPTYEVEVYVHGVYDWNESKTFSTRGGKAQAKRQAAEFAAAQIARLL